jgi:hypothetical protein
MDTIIAAIIPSLTTVVGALIIFFRWVGKIDSLVASADNLAKSFDSFRESTADRLTAHDIVLGRHDVRIANLEGK